MSFYFLILLLCITSTPFECQTTLRNIEELSYIMYKLSKDYLIAGNFIVITVPWYVAGRHIVAWEVNLVDKVLKKYLFLKYDLVTYMDRCCMELFCKFIFLN